ncbi:MAG: BrnT family toxin [Ardenticatenaceae bacterium]
MSQTFDRDESKAAANLQKHKISFEEASSVFSDPLFITFYDEEHSRDAALRLVLQLA